MPKFRFEFSLIKTGAVEVNAPTPALAQDDFDDMSTEELDEYTSGAEVFIDDFLSLN